ncbi:uncharacterized protein LOC131886615 [Tigriopus californicus]|uniref:uncharacterized protein LOC131886615 n=1 Tax=Tigriopus californicus TaxID=6832 RepID=UPI0027D9CFE5|nr:uncharacterized protein LOC131886615 [Tigriopus californicus]
MTKIYESTASLASIYQARKSGDSTVNVLKQQFQTQIERKKQAVPMKPTPPPNPMPSVVASITPMAGAVPSERDGVRKLTREKSFDEARTAVQSQIEKMFQTVVAKKEGQNTPHHGGAPPVGPERRYTMHGVSHLAPDEVPVMSHLPIHGMSLQTLLEKKREKTTFIDPIEEVSKENSQTSTLQSNSGRDSQTMLPFRIHDSNGSTISRHYSIDNLALHEETYARQKYTSMMNLSNAMAGPGASLKNSVSSRHVQGDTPGDGTEQMLEFYDDVSTPPRRVLPPVNPRDASLLHLGRISPEEQLDKFLQSVEEVNAENEKILNGEESQMLIQEQKSKVKKHVPPLTAANRSRNLRQDSSIVNRWHSMESVNPPGRGTRSNSPKKAAISQASILSKKKVEKAPNSPSKMTKKRAPAQPLQSTNKIGFREINGPKSFASMSQLDSLKSDSMVSEAPSFLKMKKPLAPASFSTGKYSENTSSNKSTMQGDLNNKRNSKPRAPRVPPASNRPLGPRAKSEEALNVSPRSIDGLHTHNKMKLGRASRPSKVIYLGSIPLSSQASDLSSLQIPLKSLYFNYIEQITKGVDPLNSSLEITDTGLKINYIRERQKGVQEIFNPFPTIAVWAAVRFVYKRKPDSNGQNNFQFAFLPLISDPGDAEKNQLFSPLPNQDLKHAASTEHPSMFACIMRRNGPQKRLECHGFVCHSKEEAVDIASNLYSSLMETMRQQWEDESSPTEVSVSTPTRPPRKKRRGRKAVSDETSNAESSRSRRTRDISNQKSDIKRSQSEKFLNESHAGRMQRSASERRSDTDTLTRKKGDIYTKVAMPRSKSFMNVSGQYNLQELFKELRDKEGIESIDDILRHVISRDGMSFNKISPMYRELLMKLAMSMSGDEMFIRSKNIIMADKLKKNRHSGKEDSPLSRIFHVFGLGKRGRPSLSQQSKLNKADIGQPIPLNEETKTQLTKQWMKSTPELILAKQAVKKSTPSKIPLKATDKASSYMSCSECDYQSACGTQCDCSMVTTTADELDPPRSAIKKSTLPVVPTASPRKRNQPSSYSSTTSDIIPASNGSSSKELMTKSSSNNNNSSSNSNSSNIISKKKNLRQQQAPPPPPPKASTSSSGSKKPTSIQQQIQQMTPTTVQRMDYSSCSCQSSSFPENRDHKDETTTCYSCFSCTSDEGDYNSSQRSHHGSIDDDGLSDGSDASSTMSEQSAASYLGTMDSPQTAWQRRNLEILQKKAPKPDPIDSDGEGCSSSEESDGPDGSSPTNPSIRSIIQKVQMATEGHAGHSSLTSSKSRSIGKGAEHVDGFFRNLNMNPEEQNKELGNDFPANNGTKSFREVNNAKSGSRLSLDSLSSSSSSSSSSTESSSSSELSVDSMVNGRKGPRPAYSEANMQNSLGYLP